MTRVIVNVHSPTEAALCRPVPVVRRCLNCSGYECEDIRNDPNAMKAMHDIYIHTDCPSFYQNVTVIQNDPREIKNLERFAIKAARPDVSF